MPAFARAFGCKAGSPMTGSRIWYRDPRPPRAVPRPAGSMTEREQQQKVDWASANWFWSVIDNKLIDMPGSQGDSGLRALGKLRARHAAERQALSDALGLTRPGAIPTARWRRTSGLFVRQLGEARALLPPTSQAMFDAQVRSWVRQFTEPSWNVAIPWLAP
jgi:hypothetical protein